MIQSTYSHPYWEVRNYLYGWVCAKVDQGRTVERYPFETYEWAMLCKQSMDRYDKILHDHRWGASMGTILWNHQGQLTSSFHLTMSHWQLENKPIVVWDHNSQVVKFDIPALVWIWLKTSWVPKAYKSLMWGEKGKQ